jgi:hypothetical protein
MLFQHQLFQTKLKRAKKKSITYLIPLALVLLCSMQSSWGQITQRGTATTATAAGTNNTTITINKPTGVVAGDVLLFSVVQNETDNDNGGLSSPTLSGWTLVKDILIRSDGTIDGSNAWFGSIYYRVSDGSEGASFSFAMNSRCDMAIGSMVAFSGVACNALTPSGSNGGPFDIVPGNFNNANAAAATANSVSVSNNNSAVIMFAMVNNDRSYSGWSNSQSELFDNFTTDGDDASVGAAWISSVNSGATGNRTVTLSGSGNDRNSAILLVLRRATTVGAASSTPTICINTALTNITHATTGASGIGIATGLPAGVTAAWASNAITISGTPTASGTFNYSIPLIGGCGSVNATGTITVLSAPIQFPTLVNGDYVWTGALNENWSNASNWMVFNSANNSFSIATTNPNSSVLDVVIPPINTCNTAGISTIRNNRLDEDRDVKNITILSNGKVTVDGTDDLDVFGNWINNGTFDHNNQDAKVDFKHQTNLQTIGGTNETAFYKLEISENNANNVILNQNISVVNDFKFDDNRKLEIGNNSLLFISGASISGANHSRYIVTNGVGVVKRNVSSGNVTFPVGISLYNPCRLSNSGTGDVFSVRVIDNVTDNGTGIGATTSAKCVKRTWMISEDIEGGSNVTMRLQWNGNNAEHINGFTYNAGFMYIAHHNGTNWENKGSSDQSNTANADFVSQSNITNFSPFAIADASTPLPIELVSFQANCAGDNKINVTWTTASEHNTSHYIVEHSRSGNDWEQIAMLAAAGNSTNLLDYTYVYENPNAGTNYYRLTQYDNDGESEQFNAVAVDCDNMNNTTTLSTYPNPSAASFYVSLFTEEMEGAGVLTITDSRGSVVYTQDVNIQNGNSIFNMENLQVAPGMYYIQITNGSNATDIVKHSLR